ncbi:MAG TPA: hypothetical protein VE860_17295 [Chthoniobacterales bacterium]|nr:hypothetical protein [Chthoniobacterales bacterium]
MIEPEQNRLALELVLRDNLVLSPDEAESLCLKTLFSTQIEVHFVSCRVFRR